MSFEVKQKYQENKTEHFPKHDIYIDLCKKGAKPKAKNTIFLTTMMAKYLSIYNHSEPKDELIELIEATEIGANIYLNMLER